MANRITPLDLPDPPPLGRPSETSLGKSHTHFSVNSDADEMTLRLHFLLAANPGIVQFRTDALESMDVGTKNLLLSQIVSVLSLDKPLPKLL